MKNISQNIMMLYQYYCFWMESRVLISVSPKKYNMQNVLQMRGKKNKNFKKKLRNARSLALLASDIKSLEDGEGELIYNTWKSLRRYLDSHTFSPRNKDATKHQKTTKKKDGCEIKNHYRKIIVIHTICSSRKRSDWKLFILAQWELF